MWRVPNFVNRAFSGVCSVLLAVFFLGLIAWFTVPRYLGWQPQVVLSGSMEPTLRTGGVAFVEPRRADEIKVGDVLTFKRPDKPSVLVTHRVTGVANEQGGPSFKTRGDANEDVDDWTVPSSNVVGTVEWSVPYLGYLTQGVRTPHGFLLLIGLPAAYIVLGEVQNIARELRKARDKAASL
jgi:signal peptidase